MTTMTLAPPGGTKLREGAWAGHEQARVRRQWLDVDGVITDRLLVTYRAPAAALEALVPAPFVVDAWRGHGFVSVCALEVRDMGLRGAPRALRFDNRELLYRVGVRFGTRPTFITLRSDTGSRALALLGRQFSHYGLRHAEVSLCKRDGELAMRCRSPRGEADAELFARLEPREHEPVSVFASAAQAAEHLLSMSCSVAAERGRVLVQPIEHEPWQPRFVPLVGARFDYLRGLERRHHLFLEYDSTLHVQGVRQRWRAARWTV